MKTKIIKGKYNTVEMVDPKECYFIAHYPDGVVKGNNLIDTGWQDLQDGITKLEYRLSTGQLIGLPPLESYLHLVEVSQSLETGNRMYHSVHIKGQIEDDVIDYKIILRQAKGSDYKIGTVLVSKDDGVMKSPHWKKGLIKEI